MVRLEPGDEALRARRLRTRRKRRKACILCRSRRDRLAHALEAMDERIARDLEEVALAVQDAPDEAVEQGVALGVAVGDHHAGSGRRRRAAGASGAPSRRTSSARTGRATRRSDQATRSGGDPGRDEAAGGRAEAVEVGAGRRAMRRAVRARRPIPSLRRGGRPRPRPHQNRLNCSGRLDEPCAQIEPVESSAVGRWSAAIRKGRARLRPEVRRATSSSRRVVWRRAPHDLVDRPRAEARHPQQHLALGRVHVDREAVRGSSSAQASLGSMSRSSMPSSPPRRRSRRHVKP